MRSSSKAWRALTVLGMAVAALAPFTAAQAAPAVDVRQGGEFEIRTFADKCFDVKGRSPADATPIIQYACDGQFNQRFRILPVGGGEYEIRTFADKCFDVKGRSPADATPIIQYACDGQFNQRFRIVA
ncbi:RICIN domain-containing protein [Kitasatospora sp. NPDC001175]|uniref:RICIN domain-containing protein n=1 Tax=Kitasatospora sp. NPDC001175 TaxID=3157103 RepID=UPI003D010B1B